MTGVLKVKFTMGRFNRDKNMTFHGFFVRKRRSSVRIQYLCFNKQSFDKEKRHFARRATVTLVSEGTN